MGAESLILQPERFNSEQEKVARFQEVLQNIEVLPLTVKLDLDEPQPIEKAQKDFFAQDFSGNSTFYALPEISHELEQDLIGFVPYVSRGGHASAHGVFFGTLTFSDGYELPVAVKPHDIPDDSVESKRAAEDSCLRDYFTNAATGKCALKSLEPVGFILDETNQPYSLTVLDEKLTSLDSIDWTHFFEKEYETEGMRELLHKVALHAANLHDTGYSYHGDLAARNIATNLYGHVFFIDWEKGNLTNCPAPDVEERFGKTWIDLKSFMLSMVKPPYGSDPGVGMFTQCENDWWDEFNDVFFADYVEMRRELAKQGSHHMRKLRETNSELAQLEHSLQLEIDRWQTALQPNSQLKAA